MLGPGPSRIRASLLSGGRISRRNSPSSPSFLLREALNFPEGGLQAKVFWQSELAGRFPP
jgi:hypothetical protein